MTEIVELAKKKRVKIPLEGEMTDPWLEDFLYPEKSKKRVGFWKEVGSYLTENQWKKIKYFIIANLSVKENMELEGISADAVKGWVRGLSEISLRIKN